MSLSPDNSVKSKTELFEKLANETAPKPVKMVKSVKNPTRAAAEAQKVDKTKEAIQQKQAETNTLADRKVEQEAQPNSPDLSIKITDVGQKSSLSETPPPSTSTHTTSTPAPTALREARKSASYGSIKNAILEGDEAVAVAILKELMYQNKGADFFGFVDFLKEDPEGINVKLLNLLEEIYRDGSTREKKYVLNVLQTFLTLSCEKTAKKEFSDAALKLVCQLSEVFYLLPLFRDLISQKGEMFKLALVKLLNKSGQEQNDKLLNLLMEFHETGNDQEKDFIVSVFQTLLSFASNESTSEEYRTATVKFFREVREKAQEIIKNGEEVLEKGQAILDDGKRIVKEGLEKDDAGREMRGDGYKMAEKGKEMKDKELEGQGEEMRKEGIALIEKGMALMEQGERVEKEGEGIKGKGQEAIDKGQKMLAVLYAAAIGANENSKNAKNFILDVVFNDQKSETTIKNLDALLSENFTVLADNKFYIKLAFDKRIIKSEENLLLFIKKLIENFNRKAGVSGVGNDEEVQEISAFVHEYDSLKRFPVPKELVPVIPKNFKFTDLIEELSFYKCLVEAYEDYHLNSEVINNFKRSFPLGLTSLNRQKGLHSDAHVDGLVPVLRKMVTFFENNCEKKAVARNLEKLKFQPGGIFWEYEREEDAPGGISDGSITKLRKKITRLRDADPVGNKEKIAGLVKKQHALREKMHKELDKVIAELSGALKDRIA